MYSLILLYLTAAFGLIIMVINNWLEQPQNPHHYPHTPYIHQYDIIGANKRTKTTKDMENPCLF